MSQRRSEPAFSLKWATLEEVATHFRVSTTTVRLGRGPFALLRRVTVGKRTLILRADFAKVDRELERSAVDLTGAGVADTEEGRSRRA